jgi:hypothetical protein
MYDRDIRFRALALLGQGLSLNAVSQRTGISRAAIRSWRDSPTSSTSPSSCPRCSSAPLDPAAYALLLGYYLGDGCLSRMAKNVYALRVTCDAKYPKVIDDVERAMAGVRPHAKTYRVRAPGCVVVQGMWKHWVCLFPQHGPGRKHDRRIALSDWQQDIADKNPEALLRGLFLSDGCRILNWTVRPLQSGPKRYEYVRYHFSNASEDIMAICTDALAQIGVHCTRPRERDLSVARRADVARLDEFIGPKS